MVAVSIQVDARCTLAAERRAKIRRHTRRTTRRGNLRQRGYQSLNAARINRRYWARSNDRERELGLNAHRIGCARWRRRIFHDFSKNRINLVDLLAQCITVMNL